MDATGLLQELGVDLAAHAGRELACRSPIDGAEIAALRADGSIAVQAKIAAAAEAWRAWRVFENIVTPSSEDDTSVSAATAVPCNAW